MPSRCIPSIPRRAETATTHMTADMRALFDNAPICTTGQSADGDDCGLGWIMAVDVLTEIVIDRPLAEVAAYAADPTNAPDWYVNIKSVEWQTPPPVAVGSRMDFVAQ